MRSPAAVGPPTNDTSKHTASHGGWRSTSDISFASQIASPAANWHAGHGSAERPEAVEVKVGKRRLEPMGSDIGA